MKIISFNVNGIRSAINKGLLKWLKEENPDLFCAQEIKAQKEQINVSAFQSIGYSYSLIHSAQKNGYSGVALFSKIYPENHSIGIAYPSLFYNEGRVLRADFGNLTIVCVYIPSGTMGEVRQRLKMKFLEIFTKYLLALQQERPNLLICGDFNICRQEIDINHPEKHVKVSGFLPEERAWFDCLIHYGFVDSFREFHQEANWYTWWSYRAKAKIKNLGWRIDYHIITENLKKKLISASILTEISLSDHCPIAIELQNSKKT